jgi:DNA-binding transcriptional ArsR family regulator
MNGQAELQAIADPRKAAVLFQQPIRLRILELAQAPVSATGLAGELGMARQKVNYHVRTLARAGLLRRAGQRKRRNMIEQRYVAAARAFVLAPELLGRLGAHARAPQDALGAGALVALLAKAQADAGAAMREAAAGRPAPTLTLASDFRFEDADQGRAFAEALRDAVLSVIDRYTSPALTGAGEPAPGTLHRLVLGCYEVALGAGAGRSALGAGR